VVEVLSRYSNPPAASKRLVSVHAAALSEYRAEPVKPPRRRLRRLTAAEEAELIAGYRAHVPVKELAVRFGIRRQTVNAILRRHDVATHRIGLSPAQVTSAARLYRDGWSLTKLGEKFRVDGMTVRRYLLLEGVMMRSPNDRQT
jgi:hypothetical protein